MLSHSRPRTRKGVQVCSIHACNVLMHLKLKQQRPISNMTILSFTGLLEASGNFMVQHQNNNTVQLSWIPPYTFPEVPITHFHLSWFNLMTGLNGTVLLTPSLVSNDSETGRFLYDFSTDDISPCHVYEFQLRAQNGGGLGAATDSVQGYFVSGKSYTCSL